MRARPGATGVTLRPPTPARRRGLQREHNLCLILRRPKKRAPGQSGAPGKRKPEGPQNLRRMPAWTCQREIGVSLTVVGTVSYVELL